jgi:hypothetical protein
MTDAIKKVGRKHKAIDVIDECTRCAIMLAD